ncbi:MAG: hypothetical protein U0163_16135 [Gemmatimonadaceae bacterium]
MEKIAASDDLHIAPLREDGVINDRIDAAYRTKYAGSPHCRP